jgi:DNA-binding CsgD family transcriptional regulator
MTFNPVTSASLPALAPDGKRQIAIVGCGATFSRRLRGSVSAEFPDREVIFFDKIEAFADGRRAEPWGFEMVMFDAVSFGAFAAKLASGKVTMPAGRIAVALEDSLACDAVFDAHSSLIFSKGISLLPMNSGINAWLCLLSLVHTGSQYLPASIAMRLMSLGGAAPATCDPEALARIQRLTPREREILAAIGDGMSNRAIATEFGISEHTVKIHIHRVISKLEVSNRTSAAVFYLGHRALFD